MLYGRAAETGALDEVIARARDGVGGAVVLRGEAGMGKTALLVAAANHRLAAMANPDFEPVGVLDQVKAPTLVIEGSHEPVKPGHGAIIAEQIPGVRLMIMAGMGHTLLAYVTFQPGS
ncbi:AAA family ATPase [Planosporangium sp. 12N6]|uniref:AAA family ATPase n=1 Tax=Planosporangium spinosum TaxID=3402278 RepID=UPI003CFA7E4A